MKKSFTIFSLLLVLNFAYSQKKYELGKVTLEELQEKKHPKDTSAVAAILFQKGNIYFDYSQDKGFDLTTVVKTRIKIYKKEGYDYANYIQKYYVGNNSKQAISFDDAVTYNLVDGKIEKTKLKSDGIFDEKVNKYWSQKKITMPNIKEGSIIEFSFKIKADGIGEFIDWDFQKDIPVNYSEFITNIPEYFIYNPYQKGSIFPKKTIEKNSKTMSYSYREKPEPGESVISSTSREKFDFIETRTTYIAQDLPALKDESYVNNIKNYTSSLSHELTRVQYPNQPYKSFSTNWEQVTKTIYDSDEFGAELNKSGYFENDITTLLTGITDQNEKIATIFNFVKSKIKWDNYLGFSTNNGVKTAYKNGTGNVAEINLMLIAMLRFAKIEANPVLVSTRKNGISYFPSIAAYDYVIAAVEINQGLILLDATEKNSLPNILPIRDLNWFGRLVRKDATSAEVNLNPTLMSKDNVSIIATINKDGNIEGKVREQHLDYNAYQFRDVYGDLAKEPYLEKLEKSHNNIEVDGYEVTGKKELNDPIVENYNFKYNNGVEIIGDKMYFSPLLFLATTQNPFKQDKREYPIDFVFPNQDKYLINISIPDGYAVEYLPISVSIPMSDNLMGLKYMISTTNNKIQLSVTYEVNTAIIGAEYYSELKAVFEEIVKKETEKIVLKKV